MLTHTKPGPPPGACGFVAFSVIRPGGAGLAAGRGFPAAFAFLGVGLAPGEAAGGPGGAGDAAFSAAEGVSGGDLLGVGD